MSIEDDIAFLERVPTLALIGREALRVIAISVEHFHLGSGDTLFREGEVADCAYVVRSGAFAVGREDPRLARRTGQAARVGPATLLGEMALLTETRRPATATAITAAEVLRVPRNVFLRTLESYPDAARRLTKELSAQISATLVELDRVRERLDAIDGGAPP
ncbi:Crp/Fnr family transcriptional regulator [Starkeya koreensis]|uniref:Crp/Fnr family transcriptional regulator n=1 Tax=Ancylobacter koreensis TaxID=266121 RepID=A0ABT0DHK2_9HYPH|nr:Crp/Fnr family transcriptional regulator [Ancylobacter koreensis]MCK0206766.1 Crp/Fnr family transcriptional regulator [Ancylobacter koreensis]